MNAVLNEVVIVNRHLPAQRVGYKSLVVLNVEFYSRRILPVARVIGPPSKKPAQKDRNK